MSWPLVRCCVALDREDQCGSSPNILEINKEAAACLRKRKLAHVICVWEQSCRDRLTVQVKKGQIACSRGGEIE